MLNMAWRQLCFSVLMHSTVSVVSKANLSSKVGVWHLKDFHWAIDQICQAPLPLHTYFAFASVLQY